MKAQYKERGGYETTYIDGWVDRKNNKEEKTLHNICPYRQGGGLRFLLILKNNVKILRQKFFLFQRSTIWYRERMLLSICYYEFYLLLAEEKIQTKLRSIAHASLHLNPCIRMIVITTSILWYAHDYLYCNQAWYGTHAIVWLNVLKTLLCIIYITLRKYVFMIF